MNGRPLPDVSAFAAQFVEDDDEKDEGELLGSVPQSFDPHERRDAFLAQIERLHAAARDRAEYHGRRARVFAAYGVAAFGISLVHVPAWLGFWLWAIAVFWGLRALLEAEAWNSARIESRLSPF